MKQQCKNCKKEIEIEEHQTSMFIQCEHCGMFWPNKNSTIKTK